MPATKQSEEVHYYGAETSPLKSTFQVIHIFSTDVIKCVCVCVIMLVYALSVWNKLVLLVGSRGHDGLFFEMAVVCFMGHTFKPMSHHLWLNSRTLSSHCWRPWYRLTWLSNHCMNLAAIWPMLRFTFRMFQTHPDEIPNLLSTLWVVILPFSRTSGYTLSPVLLVNEGPTYSAPSIEITLL